MSESAVPGWYHAEGDPPNTERYWDGTAWTEGPRPIGGISTPETPPVQTPADQADIPTVMSDTPIGDVPSMDTPSVPDLPSIDTPSVPDMPAMDTGSGGLDAGFPSIDDTPSPGAFGSNVPTPPSSAPAYPPPGAAMPPVNMGSGPSVTPGFGGPPAFPGAPSGGMSSAMFAEESQATTSLVASVFGLFCCGLPAVLGVYLGYKEKQGIDAGRRDPSKRGQTIAGLVIGGLALLIWGFFAIIILIAGLAG